MNVYIITASNGYSEDDKDYRTVQYTIVAVSETHAKLMFNEYAHWVFDTFVMCEQVDATQPGVYMNF
jgi:hypothetical protein